MSSRVVPPGYVRFTLDGTDVVCLMPVEHAVRTALARGTLYEYAKAHADARSLAGRAPAYAVPLPGDVDRAVVRHNNHGGLFARVTGDLFRTPGRAPRELETSERLRSSGVPTPVLLAYTIYRAPVGLCRSDVLTREVPDSFDLAAALMSDDAALRAESWTAAARLVAVLSQSGARHHDLNAKNILLGRAPDGGVDPFVLDVDRVTFDDATGAGALAANVARLVRSARKWRDLHGAHVSESELTAFTALARELVSAPTLVRTP